MNEDGTFNPLIMVDKLTKLNCSQQSIETLSNWCIFHRKNAKQIVETWERQFHSSPKEQKVSFLYLANDILQNSRRKGVEFVIEFWDVLPQALADVMEHGDDNGKKAAHRLISIWEDRKVFYPRGQNLKEEFFGRYSNGKSISYKLKEPTGDMLEKLISSYKLAYDGLDEDALFGKCRTAILSVERVVKDIGNDIKLDEIPESGIASELQVQQRMLGECMEHLKATDTARTNLMSQFKKALSEQESKSEQLWTELQARYILIDCLMTGKEPPPPLPRENPEEIPPPPPISTYSDAPPPPDCSPESTTTAVAVSANPNYVIPSPAANGVIRNSIAEDYSYDANKKARFSNGGDFKSIPCFLPQPQQQLPPPPFLPPRPLPLSPVPLPLPLPLPQFSYGSAAVMNGYPMLGAPPYPGPTNPFNFQGPPENGGGGSFVGQPPFPPVFRQ